ncbi:hypothetical protein COCC4DRAFT_146377 [Bipolaris maydis ATCC 48331]|uniref:Uncharacterized protein n=2 Tax=Cochliobolus heterostrophus TaxID=5016 RepID=M2UDT3_COCH5|nr:uncharacterized protein COCC4DRAFT_146377 [Bipolaris maydis ATCC 48331]EMD86057.1 hypothetical protein COCHEDRAFT_1035119 [Bipolaris maydis C5]ENI02060.1 hypothetical protein COCC4DRAFT_146377 [Bipolaris maydis ATCC 48331]KAH7562785.1 hypothetical protein BM1_02305 [Bipolaris maydis]
MVLMVPRGSGPAAYYDDNDDDDCDCDCDYDCDYDYDYDYDVELSRPLCLLGSLSLSVSVPRPPRSCSDLPGWLCPPRQAACPAAASATSMPCRGRSRPESAWQGRPWQSRAGQARPGQGAMA